MINTPLLKQFQTVPSSTTVVHNVIISDATGSMSGSKYNASKEGIMNELQQCKDLNMTFTYVEMVQTGKILTYYTKADPKNVSLAFYGAKGNDTPLYQTVYDTLTNLYDSANGIDKYLVKIFTDGQDTTRTTSAFDVGKLIKKCEEKGFTVTFVGTDRDVKSIANAMSIDLTNTLGYNNTGEGLKQAFQVSNKATLAYRKSVDKGENVTKGFYSKVLNNQ